MPAQARILIVEDNAALRGIFAKVLSSAGYLVHTEADAEGGIRAVERLGCFDLATMDYRLPGRSGAVAQFELEQRCPNMPIVFVTGVANAAEELPGRIVLAKPVLPRQLLDTVEALLREPPP